MAATQWWVISEASSSNLNGSFVVVSGTAAAIKAKYGAAAGGPYSTQAAAQTAANTIGGGFPGANISGNPGTAIKQGLSNIPGASSVGDFLGRLDEGSTWIRIAEGVLGLLLIAVGVARLTHAVPIATQVASAAAKGALA